MRRFNIFRTGFLGLLAITAVVFWNCLDANTSDKPVTLSLQLSDSLSVQNGLYDSVRIDIYDGSRKIFKAAIFHGPYDKNANKETLSNLNLGVNPPNPMAVKITAYRKNGDILTISFDVNNNVSGSPDYKIVSLAIDPNKPSDTTSKPPVNQPVDTTNPNKDSLPVIIPPESVVIDTKGPLVLAVSGVSVELQSRVLPVTANPTVEWFSADSGIADIVNGNSVKPIAIGKTTLIVRSKEDPSKFKTLEVEVQAEPITVKKVTITNSRPFKISTSNSNVALEASVDPLGAVRDVNWSSSDTSIAIILVNQIKGLKVGSSKITARSISDPGIFDTITVEVQVGAVDPTSLEILNTSPLVLIIGNSNTELKTTILPSGADPSVVWTSADISIASIESGTYAKGNKAGETILTATSKVNSSLKKTIAVKVQSAVIKPKSVTITIPDPMNLAPNGIEGDLAAKIEPADAKPDVIWESKDTSIVKITATNKAKPIKIGSTKIIVTSKEDPTLADTLTVDITVPVKVEGITLSPKTMKLYTGGDSLQVIVTLVGNDPGAKYALNSSNSTVASVRSDGFVKGLKAGQATISATVVGATLSDSCKVEVLTDAPVVTVTDNSPITYNGEAVFTVTVTQAFGKTLEISADMDGNGAFDTSITNKETATFKKKYSANTVVTFEARDTEGNKTKITRNLVVQAPGAPVVKITVPTKDVTIKEVEYPITFSVTDPALGTTVTKDSTVKGLVEGNNLITVTRNNAGGTGSATITIKVDRTPPPIPSLKSPSSPTPDNTPTWTWAATGDATKYQVKLNSTDFSAGSTDVFGTTYTAPTQVDGNYTLSIRSLDSLGNASSASTSSNLTIKTSNPGTPKLLTSPASPTNTSPLNWTWSSGGNGNGTYHLWVNDVAQADVTSAKFSLTNPSTGTYVVKISEIDDVNHESPPFTFGSVVFDKNAPTITVSGYANGSVNTLTSTTKVSISGTIVDGSTGSGIKSATYSLSGKTTKSATTITSPQTFSLGTITLVNSGVTTLTINTTDNANNPQSYVIDFNVSVQKPQLEFVTPTPRDGYITSSASASAITVYYKIDGGATISEVVSINAPSNGTGSNSKQFSKTVTNDAGTTTISRTFYRAGTNVSFFTPTGTKLSGCTDWEQACRFAGDLSGFSGSMWLRYGNYDITQAEVKLKNQVQVYGGLKNYGINTDDLQNGQESILAATSTAQNDYYLNTATVLEDGAGLIRLTITGDFREAAIRFNGTSSHTLSRCKFTGLHPEIPYAGVAFQANGRDVTLDNCIFDNNFGDDPFISNAAEYGTLTFQDCNFGNNIVGIETTNTAKQAFMFLGTTSGTTPRVDPAITCGLTGTKGCN